MEKIQILKFILKEIRVFQAISQDDLQRLLSHALYTSSEIIGIMSTMGDSIYTQHHLNAIREAVIYFKDEDYEECKEYMRQFQNLLVDFEVMYEDTYDQEQLILDTENILSKRFENDGKSNVILSISAAVALDKIKISIESDEYTSQKTTCFCGGESFTIISHKEKHGLPIKSGICRKCGLIMSMTMISDVKKFYSEYYSMLYLGNDYDRNTAYIHQVQRGIMLHTALNEYLPKDVTPKVLDVGCEVGGILAVFKGEGCDAIGTDLYDGHVEFAQRMNINALNCELEELIEDHARSFDLIMLSNVVQNFYDLKKEFRAIKKLLKPDGYLYVELVNIKNIKIHKHDYLRYLQIAHNYNFSVETLNQTLRALGFEFLAGTDHTSALFRNNSDIARSTVLSNYHDDILGYMSTVEKIFFAPE